VAVVGIGDIPTATYVEPPLTTVALPTREMGEAAMDVLLRLMRGEKPPEEPVTLPVQLVRRGSA
jgi:LacI family transcriptional regulator